MPAPILETPRLRLRPLKATDMEAFWQFFHGTRAQYLYPIDSRQKFWTGFTSDVGSWELFGYGIWGLETREGVLVGQTGLSHPPLFPEMELGWILLDGFEGKGYATEAAEAALLWTWATQSTHTLVSYIDPRNARSISLAERLGAVIDPLAERPGNDTAQDCVVYRHSPTQTGSIEAPS